MARARGGRYKYASGWRRALALWPAAASGLQQVLTLRSPPPKLQAPPSPGRMSPADMAVVRVVCGWSHARTLGGRAHRERRDLRDLSPSVRHLPLLGGREHLAPQRCSRLAARPSSPASAAARWEASRFPCLCVAYQWLARAGVVLAAAAFVLPLLGAVAVPGPDVVFAGCDIDSCWRQAARGRHARAALGWGARRARPLGWDGFDKVSGGIDEVWVALNHMWGSTKPQAGLNQTLTSTISGRARPDRHGVVQYLSRLIQIWVGFDQVRAGFDRKWAGFGQATWTSRPSKPERHSLALTQGRSLFDGEFIQGGGKVDEGWIWPTPMSLAGHTQRRLATIAD